MLNFLKAISGFLFISVTLIVLFQFVINPKYSFPATDVFKGEKLYNPYSGMDSTKWKRANFHLHTRLLYGLTAGAANSNQIAENFYKYFNYDIYSISDYMKVNRSLGNSKVFIPAYEHGYQYYKTHQLVLNANRICWTDYFFRQTLDNKQYIINRLKKDTSTLVAIVHPKYRDAYLPSDFANLGNYDCFEIANSIHPFVKFYDRVLSTGHPVFIMADDDAHDLSDISDGAHSFNIINTDLKESTIIHSLKTGKSYGVNFNLQPYKTNYDKKAAIERLPVLTAVDLHNDTLVVIMNQSVDSIKFIGQNGILKGESLMSKTGKYHFGRSDTYIRTEIVCNDGSVYYLNPVFRYDGSSLPSNTPEVNVLKTWTYRSAVIAILFLMIFVWRNYRSKVHEEIKKFYPLIIAVSAILFFIPFLGSVHLFDWDEINFAESAREMIVTGDFSRVQIDFQPFWEKPPLFFWLQAGSMKIFGINEFAARLPNAIFGVISLLTFYFIGRKLYDEKFGLIWALAYMGSFLPHLYFKSGIIDPVFNYFIFLTVFGLFSSINEQDERKSLVYALAAGISIGLATLTKGPAGFLIVSISVFVYWISVKFKKITTVKKIIVFAVAFLLVSSLWFGLEMIKNGPWFFKEFIRYQADLFLKPVAGHGGPFYYHFLIVFFGCFPISVIAMPLFYSKSPVFFKRDPGFLKWMIILFWVVMILFSIVTTKIVHYSSLAYFPLSFIATCFIYELINERTVLKKYHLWILAITGAVFSFLLAAVPYLAQNKDLILKYINDPFAVACLNSPVKWYGYEYFTGIFYLIAVAASIVMLRRKNFFKGFITLFYATSVCLFIYLLTVVPKIEKYSQAPVINFLQSISGKDVYASTYGFYSYAPFFYFQKMPGGNIESSSKDWLLNGAIDKPVYLIAKVTSRDLFDKHPDFKLIGQEGGFLFYLRIPTK